MWFQDPKTGGPSTTVGQGLRQVQNRALLDARLARQRELSASRRAERTAQNTPLIQARMEYNAARRAGSGAPALDLLSLAAMRNQAGLTVPGAAGPSSSMVNPTVTPLPKTITPSGDPSPVDTVFQAITNTPAPFDPLRPTRAQLATYQRPTATPQPRATGLVAGVPKDNSTNESRIDSIVRRRPGGALARNAMQGMTYDQLKAKGWIPGGNPGAGVGA